MIRMTKNLVAVAALLGATFGAEAADLSGPPPVVPYTPVVSDPGSPGGWYLRGDVGVGLLGTGHWADTTIDTPTWDPGTTGTTRWLDRSIGDTSTIDVGVGYQFNDYLRGDITAQYRTATSFHGGNVINNTTTGAFVENADQGRLSSTVVLANGYWDIGHFNGLTPFVGAGVGAAYNKIDGMYAIAIGGGGTNGLGDQYGQYTSKGSVSLAYALHAGLSYDINSRLKLEGGYSYLGLGSVGNKLLTCSSTAGTTACGDNFKLKNIYSNDFHIGMRWLLDAPQSDPHIPTYRPVVAKY